MNTAQVLGYPLLLIAALELLLGRLLLTHNPRNSAVNKATAACVFAAALWSLSAALMYIHISLGRDYLFFARLSWVGWFTVPTAIQSVLFLTDEKSRRARIAGAVLYPFWTAVLALCLVTDLVVTDRFIPLPYRNSPGPLEMPLRLIGGLLVLWLYVEIVRLRRQVTGFRRSQLSYYLYGTLIFGTGGAIVGGFLQLFTGTGLEPSLGAYFGFPWMVMIFYAITRYRLFDIRIVLSRVLYILTLSLVVSGFQFLLFKALEPVLGGVATIFISIPIIGIIFFGTPLGGNVQRWVNELVLRDRLAYQKLLKESANAAVSILHLDELLHFLVERVRDGLKVERACLYLRNDRGAFVNRACFWSLQEPNVTPAFPERVAELMAAGPRMLVREELEAELRPEDRELAAALAGLGTELLIPLVSKKRVLGILSLGERANGETYLTNDLEVLQALADQAAIAIENAMLFEEAGRMRTSLMEQEELFRTLAQTLPAAIFIHRGGKFLYFNAAGTRMTGYSADEILHMDFWGVVHPDYRELIMARGRSRLAGEEAPPQYEFKILRKDGSERWVLMTAGTIPYEGKTAVIGTIFDITDRKTAEEEREHYYQERLAEQERFAAVLSTTTDGFWVVDDKGRLTFVNDAYCRMSGYRREELLTMTISDLEVRESPERVRQHLDRIMEEGRDRFETRHRRKDGSLIELEISVNRSAGERMAFAFLRDITDRKVAEAALRESEERFRQVSETAQEWIWEVDRDGRYTYSSPVIATLLGYQPDEVVGNRFFYDFFMPDEREQLKREAFQVFRAKATFRDFTNRNLHKDGREVVLSTSGTPILDSDGTLLGYRGVDFDISERIRAERERRGRHLPGDFCPEQ